MDKDKVIVFRNYAGESISETFVYDSSDKPLVTFFNRDADKLIKGRISTIKTIYLENKFIGYFTLSMSSVEANSLLDEKRIATFPHPAIKIGRLLIDKKFRGLGIGGKIITYIAQLAQSLNKLSACRFLIVDAKKGVENFYHKNGFVEVKPEFQKSDHSTTMLFDLNSESN